MLLKEFSYSLPEELIAQRPLVRRECARLMIVDRSKKTIKHDHFYNIDKYLPENSLLVLNNSKVIPARLLGQKERSGGKVEILLLKRLSDGYSFEALLKPLRRIKEGDKIIFPGSNVSVEVIDVARRRVRFNHKDVLRRLEEIGHIPLPPYIRRADDQNDREFYQTVYARHAGSVAAPTAGLHFTPALLRQLKRKGHSVKKVTLHINYATFKPVEEEEITNHKMHREAYSVSQRTYQSILAAKKNGQRIVAVGTTSCRVLESVARSGEFRGDTELFIYPGCSLQMVDVLLTNFHLPHSTLLMLVYAFGTSALMKKAYQEAIREKYRFYSYGDAMIIV